MSNFLHRLRQALRHLWSERQFTSVAVLTLALPLAATTAIFSVVDAVLLRPLPFGSPERLVSVEGVARGAAGTEISLLNKNDIGTIPAVESIGAYQAHSSGIASIPLQYDAGLEARGFPSPLLRLSVDGHEAWFLVDTGAGVNTLAAWFVDAARIPSKVSGSTVEGSTGAASPVSVVSNLRAKMRDGRPLTLEKAVVANFPPVFKELSIGGLVSPQLLAAGGEAVVLDLRVPAITFADFDVAVAAINSRAGTAVNGSVCTNRESQFRNRLYAGRVSIDGRAADMLIDSGSTSTVLAAGSPAGRPLVRLAVGGAHLSGVGGTNRPRRVPHVSVAIGSAVLSRDILLGEVASRCGSDGLVGMETLRECVLALGRSRFAWSCGKPRGKDLR